MRSIPNHSHWSRQAPFFFRKERHGLSWLFPKREVDHDLLVAIRMLFTPKLQQEGRHLSLSPVSRVIGKFAPDSSASPVFRRPDGQAVTVSFR